VKKCTNTCPFKRPGNPIAKDVNFRLNGEGMNIGVGGMAEETASISTEDSRSSMQRSFSQ
jgi:hypothetical protein